VNPHVAREASQHAPDFDKLILTNMLLILATDFDKQAAHSASIKLDTGDVRSAVRVISSDDRFNTPDLDIFDSLLSKHPPIPHDRRPTPVVKAGSYSCRVLELIKAIIFLHLGQLRAGMVYVHNTYRTCSKRADPGVFLQHCVSL